MSSISFSPPDPKSAKSFKETPQRSTTDLGKIEGQPLPSNQDAEQGILAACLVDASGRGHEYLYRESTQTG